ncbi:oxidoreductase [Apiospora saccharicola]
MVQLTASAVLVLGAASLVASQSTSKSAWEINLDKQNKDSECNNSCFFPEFTNKCNSDNPACTCTLKAERERWYCCMAKKCDANVLPDAIERGVEGCLAWNKPIPKEFDTEAVCGIKLATTSSSNAVLASTAPAGSSSTKAPESSAAAAATPSGSATKTGSETAASTTTPPSSGASQAKGIWGAGALLLTAVGFFI